ncbi:MAG: response regulator [Anaerolineae bacterium]|nr:response regulator [Anaerolineae bacterium]
MPKVLIVDDDPTTTKLLQTLLELDGFEVEVAARGHLAIDKAQETNPDVFLIDYYLQDMKGVELVTHLRATAQFGEAPIIMASGLDHEDEAMAAGANAFLIKPFEPNLLADIFYDLLG